MTSDQVEACAMLAPNPPAPIPRINAAITTTEAQINEQQRERVEKGKTLLHKILAHSCKDVYCPIKKIKKDALEALDALKELEAE